ncbi:MAG: sugar dehydrogenase complex small subunit [Xanthobacteraceae bacterium]
MRTARLDHLLRLNRRAALGVGLAAAIPGVLPGRAARAESRVPEALQRQFLDWSRMATGFIDLPAGTVRTFLEWTLRSGMTVEDLSKLDPGTYRGTPLERRLLEAWYTGVFKIGGSSEMRSYDTTLMWQAAGIDPPPTSCGGTPDRWASAPSNI